MAHRLAPEAEADLDELWYFVASNGSIETADRLVDSITTRFFLLGRHPTLWAPARRSARWLAFIPGG